MAFSTLDSAAFSFYAHLVFILITLPLFSVMQICAQIYAIYKWCKANFKSVSLPASFPSAAFTVGLLILWNSFPDLKDLQENKISLFHAPANLILNDHSSSSHERIHFRFSFRNIAWESHHSLSPNSECANIIFCSAMYAASQLSQKFWKIPAKTEGPLFLHF